MQFQLYNYPSFQYTPLAELFVLTDVSIVSRNKISGTRIEVTQPRDIKHPSVHAVSTTVGQQSMQKGRNTWASLSYTLSGSSVGGLESEELLCSLTNFREIYCVINQQLPICSSITAEEPVAAVGKVVSFLTSSGEEDFKLYFRRGSTFIFFGTKNLNVVNKISRWWLVP